MKILAIRCYNLNSLKGAHELDFTSAPLAGCGLFAITGATAAGKTTLLDALMLALYGCTPRQKTGAALMTTGTGECWAEVDFVSVSGHYRAKWTDWRAHNKPTGNLQGPVREVAELPSGKLLTDSHLKRTQKLLDALTGLTCQQFQRSVLLAQGSFAEFLQADANDRAALLEKMTDTGRYRTLSKAAFDACRTEIEAERQLEAQLGNTELLSDEALTELESTQVQQQADLLLAQAAEDERRREAAWHTRLADLTRSLAEDAASVARAEVARATFAPERQRLAAHDDAEPFAPLLALADDSAASAQEAAAEVGRCETALTVHETAATTAAQATAKAELAATAARDAYETRRPILEEAQREATAIAEAEEVLEQDKRAYETRQTAAADQRLSAERTAEELARLQADQVARQTLHAADGAAAELTAELPELRHESQVLTHARDQHQKTARLHATRLTERAQVAADHTAHQRLAAGAEREATDHATHLTALTAEAAGLLTHELSRRDDLDERERRADAHRKTATDLYNLERKMLGYAPERQDLAHTGGPCPLCGATEHPFADHFGLTDASLAAREADVQAAEKDLDQFRRGLIISGEIVALLTDYAQTGALALAWPLLQARDHVLNLSRELPATREAAGLAGARHQSARALAATAQTRTHELDAELATLAAELEELTRQQTDALDNLRAFAARFGQVFDPAHPDRLFRELTDRATAWHERRSAIATATATIEGKQTEAATQQRLADEAAAWLATTRPALVGRHTALQARREANAARHPADAPRPAAAELTHLVEQQAATATAHTQAQEAQRRADDARLQARSSLQTARAAATTAAETARTRAATLQAALAEAGLADAPALRATLLPAAESLRLRAQRDQLDAALANVRTTHQLHLQEQLELLEAPLTTATPAQTAADLKDAQRQHAEAVGQLARTGQALETATAARERYRHLTDQVTAQRRETQRWKELSAEIGAADGDKFSRFAQGLTLARLLEFANRHLAYLYPRYRLCRPQDIITRPLDLLYQDRYQADAEREVNTLSGGESFLVSLALALALAELASNQTRIDSLFIDEGFGTLDADLLDVAIEALENLRQQGKTVGIISHVEALKDLNRIPVQVVVEKGSDGVSTLRVLPELKEAAR